MIDIPTEHQEARWFLQYCKLKGYKVTHVKNETGRPVAGRRVRNYKAMWDAIDGVSPGFPDFVVVAGNVVIFIELKRTKGGKISPAQQEWISALKLAGMPAGICRGADESIAFVEASVKAATA
jgi:hypothetical protein